MRRIPLKTYFQRLSKEEREEYAQRAGTTVGYLIQLKDGHSNASLRLAKKLVAASNGLVDINSLAK